MRTLGTLHRLDDTRGAVRVEDVYATDIEDLWDACTDPDRLARWIADVSGVLEMGGGFTKPKGNLGRIRPQALPRP